MRYTLVNVFGEFIGTVERASWNMLHAVLADYGSGYIIFLGVREQTRSLEW